MHAITFFATKRGTGRTITTMTLASGFLALGKRVSVMDCTDLARSNPKGRHPSPLQSWMQKTAANKFQLLQLELIECWTREQVEDSLAVAEAHGVDVVLVDTNARLAKPLLTALRLTYLIIATANGPFVAKYTMKDISYYLGTPEHLMGLVAGCRAGAPEAYETHAAFDLYPVFQSKLPWAEALSDQILNGDIALFASMLACKPEKLGYARFCDTQTTWVAVQRLTFEVQWSLNGQRHDLLRRSIPPMLTRERQSHD
jgi:hypothetical protein